MAWFQRGTDADGPDGNAFSKHDAGTAALDDFTYELRPKNTRITIRLAGSNPYQDELGRLAGDSDLQTAGGRRTVDEERIDAPMDIRLFADSRITGVVGTVPRGFESAVTEALNRLEEAGRKPRIPVRIVETRHGLRVELKLGATR
jgi:hypothetical protein